MAHDVQLDLDVVLPEAHGHNDRCVADLMAVLEATDGVQSAHVIEPSLDKPAQLCLSVDPGRLSLRRLAERAKSAGADVSSRYGHVIWGIGGVNHASRADNAAAIIRRIPGVLDAGVVTGGTTRVEFDRSTIDETRLRRAVEELGFPIISEELAPQRTTNLSDSGPAHGGAGPAKLAPTEGEHQPWSATSGTDAESGVRTSEEAHGHDHTAGEEHDHVGHSHGGRSELALAVGAFVVFLAARILDWTIASDTLPLLLYSAATAVTALMVGRDVLTTLRARRFDIEMLMFAAAIGAVALGDLSDAALLLVLFSLGHGLEGFAMARARRNIESLAELAPTSAHRRSPNGGLDEVPVEEVTIGDVLLVKPNERISADGVVVVGETSVDESPVTGESTPVDKFALDVRGPEDIDFDRVGVENRVYAGTLNGHQAIDVLVLKPASDSTLTRVVRLVSEAETQISPTQRLTQRIVRYFVPAVLATVTVLVIVPPLLGEGFRTSFLRAMAVLVASSPCALAIATPSAVLASIARAARGGVLVKGGGPLETLGGVCTIAFDKTGTLTQGHPRLTAVHPVEGLEADELLSLVVAVEDQSDHPIARAITSDAAGFAGSLAPVEVTGVEARVGRGVTAIVDGSAVAIGSPAQLSGLEIPSNTKERIESMEDEGITTVVVVRDSRLIGILGVRDVPRTEARTTVERLRSLGIHHTIMLSGDHQKVADAIAAQVGLDEARGALLPEDKVAAVSELLDRHDEGVAMVGDGVNDAPALAASSVGIAMGAAGSAVALETADIALMGDQLDRLPFAVALARAGAKVIRQNLFISLGMVVILVPLTIAGIGIGPAVIAHEGSTLVVVVNALRLLAHKDLYRVSPTVSAAATARNMG